MTKQLKTGHQLPPPEEYICEECGNTTPIPNNLCPNCGAPMSAIGNHPPTHSSKDDQDSQIDGDHLIQLEENLGNSETESLEDLREKEEEEEGGDVTNY